MLVRVGGVPGVGKTIVIERAVDLSPKSGVIIERARTKEVLCELAGVSTVEEYRTLPLNFRKSLYPEMDRRLYAEDQENPATVRLYDGHFYFFDPETGGYQTRTVYPEDKLQLMAIIVLAVANPETLFRRRIQDQSFRLDRQQISLELLRKEQEMEVKTAATQAEQLGIPFRVLQNEDGETDCVALQLLSFLGEYKWKIG
ncbi:MAG: hypothetical protein Q8P39_02895 [Candidatus Yanofskybacteria bacterium]|nr:hypothetical protein [Candidatus Yanofskybacteria bacterium]